MGTSEAGSGAESRRDMPLPEEALFIVQALQLLYMEEQVRAPEELSEGNVHVQAVERELGRLQHTAAAVDKCCGKWRVFGKRR